MEDEVLEGGADLFLLPGALQAQLIEALLEDLLLALLLDQQLGEGVGVVREGLAKESCRFLEGVDFVGLVGAVERALRTDQLVALQAEVDDLLVLVDLAEVGLNALWGLSRALRVDLTGLEGLEDLLNSLRLVAFVVRDGLLLLFGGLALHFPVVLGVFGLPAVVFSLDYPHLVGEL